MHHYARPWLFLKDQFLEGKLQSPRTCTPLGLSRALGCQISADRISTGAEGMCGNACLRMGTAHMKVRMLGSKECVFQSSLIHFEEDAPVIMT